MPENSLPMVLMHAWLVCPVSSLALSFWLNWYELAAGLANRLATSLHTEGLKAQLTEFVELLESPGAAVGRWEQRLCALLRALELYMACDILCFQELEIGASLEPVQGFLEERGFLSVVQDREGYPVVNATFFRPWLRLTWTSSRSRILLAGLLLPSGREVCVANVHLDARRGPQREAQLGKSLLKLEQARSSYKIVCGDFNTDLTTDPLFGILRVYGLFRAPTSGLTHANGAGLDHLCAGRALQPRLVLHSGVRELRALLGRLPCEEYPSDHLPVAVRFDIVSASDWPTPRLSSPNLPSELRAAWADLAVQHTQSRNLRRQLRALEADLLHAAGEEAAAQLRSWRDAAQRAAAQTWAAACDAALAKVFSDVRLQMLEVRHRSALLRAMLCLGALLPQEKALQGRLQVVETGLLLERVVAQRSDPAPGSCSQQAEELLAKFEEVCKLHRWKECVV
ncbi:unnamed protein product [Effrenium voratum]|nr:unnamed protein product [Effrenium voratum]